jgi:dTDP-4-dehydrorhamnose reductase
MSNPTIVVTGKNGQLGNELQVLSKKYPQFNFIFNDVAELDISDKEQVRLFFKEHKPFACINAAAYTAVDKAETEQETALKINAEAAGYLAENCKEVNARYIHISTDYVFDGSAKEPYTEDSAVSPVNYYGYTKLKGEEAALTNPSTVVIRTSWVYSYYGKNFVKTMMKLMQERESISVVNDQFGSPTYAADLAEAIMQIVDKENFNPGIYHYSNDGEISWFDFAVAIREICRFNCSVNPVDTAGYPTPAKRPAYSVLNKEKIINTYSITIKDWKESLKQCIQLLQQQ